MNDFRCTDLAEWGPIKYAETLYPFDSIWANNRVIQRYCSCHYIRLTLINKCAHPTDRPGDKANKLAKKEQWPTENLMVCNL